MFMQMCYKESYLAARLTFVPLLGRVSGYVSEVSMDQPFDIFRKNRDGSLVWRATAHSLDEVRAIVERLSKCESGIEFVILNQETQQQTTITPALAKTNAA